MVIIRHWVCQVYSVNIVYCRLEFICEGIFFAIFFFANVENHKNMIAKNFNGYIVIIVVMNFCKKF